MKRKPTGKKYNDDFKKTIVDLYQAGNSVKELSSEYGVSEVTIYKWVKEFTPISSEKGSLTSKELAEIQKENLRLKQELEIPKKGYGHIREKVTETELNHFIKKHKGQYSVQKMCEVLTIPRSSYYSSFKKTVSKREQENQEITKEIQRIYLKSKARYGAPKIHKILLSNGFYLSLKRVQRLMRKAGIRSITKKKYRPYPSKEKVVQLDNLLMRNFSTQTINEKWVADITYIPTVKDGWCYLASVLDLHSKKIVGYSFSRYMTSELVIEALQNACFSQKPRKGLILHTDLGSQYTSSEFTQYVQKHKIKQSFSQKGCPYDNTCMESFHAILKKEEVYHTQYTNYSSAKLALFQFIEGWYNRSRIHSGLGYQTPQFIEDQIRKTA
ncbi:IS3 family transposase [Priestia endophytica]|uniref:IS3 family transposase n=1 Tax=Priestia endophytica TaxID=135735 RepID=UPI000F53BAD5|nr:IS3 family transposase [Priestia endophytica]